MRFLILFVIFAVLVGLALFGASMVSSVRKPKPSALRWTFNLLAGVALVGALVLGFAGIFTPDPTGHVLINAAWFAGIVGVVSMFCSFATRLRS